MIFCEYCRLEKKWPRSLGYPYIGFAPNSKCEICGARGDCNDVPALKLIPESDRTTEQKLLAQAMNNAYREKAEALVVTNVSGSRAGNLNHEKTELLRKILVKVGTEVDWQATYELRLAAQQGWQKDEENKRNIRTGGYNGI
jgi:hypothetical protein